MEDRRQGEREFLQRREITCCSSAAKWHETLTIPSSGGSGNPITFADYSTGAKPIFNGATTVGGAWTSDGGQVYRTSWSFASNNVLQNDVPLLRKTSRAAMTAGSFFFNPASSLLYVWTFTGASPAGFTIDASTNGPQYYGIIRGINKDHIVIQNLQIVKTNYTGVYFEEADDITVTGCDFVATFQNTITLVGNLGQTNSSNVTVSNNTLTNCGTGRGLTGGGESECVGINAQGWQTGSITDNVITNQGGEGIQILSGATGITVDGNSVVNPYVTGIYVSSGYGNGGNVTNIVVSNNYVELGAMSISPTTRFRRKARRTASTRWRSTTTSRRATGPRWADCYSARGNTERRSAIARSSTTSSFTTSTASKRSARQTIPRTTSATTSSASA
jgi:hypothetical protein